MLSGGKKVADFILANPGLAVNANVSELANYSGVSDATVVRFCKHLGYEGYYQMRLLLARDIGRRTVITDMVNQDETSVRGCSKASRNPPWLHHCFSNSLI